MGHRFANRDDHQGMTNISRSARSGLNGLSGLSAAQLVEEAPRARCPQFPTMNLIPICFKGARVHVTQRENSRMCGRGQGNGDLRGIGVSSTHTLVGVDLVHNHLRGRHEEEDAGVCLHQGYC